MKWLSRQLNKFHFLLHVFFFIFYSLLIEKSHAWCTSFEAESQAEQRVRWRMVMARAIWILFAHHKKREDNEQRCVRVWDLLPERWQNRCGNLKRFDWWMTLCAQLSNMNNATYGTHNTDLHAMQNGWFYIDLTVRCTLCAMAPVVLSAAWHIVSAGATARTLNHTT